VEKRNERLRVRIRAFLAMPMVMLLALVLFPGVLIAQSASSGGGSKGQPSDGGSGGGGNSKGQGGQSSGGQGGGGQPGAPTSNSYRVEIDMLAYDAADKIAEHISSEIKDKDTKFVIYDKQTFVTLQLYEAYEAGISIFESAFRLVQSNATKSFEAGVSAAQTVVSTLAALRSTTEFGTQPVNLNTDALIAQLSYRLPGRVVVPKIILENPTLSNDLGLGSWDSTTTESSCADLNKSVPWQLACVLAQRNQAVGKPGFAEIDKLFQSFFGTLMNIGVSGNVSTGAPKAKTPSNGGDNNEGANGNPPGPQSDKTNPPAPNDGSGQSAIQSPVLFSLVLGRRLEYELRATCPSKSNHLLHVETTAAGGSYRIRHNFWWELFWTTPTPSFNGGAIVTYFLMNPCDSTVEKSDVLRYMFDYGKFKDIKPEKHGSNFSPPAGP